MRIPLERFWRDTQAKALLERSERNLCRFVERSERGYLLLYALAFPATDLAGDAASPS